MSRDGNKEPFHVIHCNKLVRDNTCKVEAPQLEPIDLCDAAVHLLSHLQVRHPTQPCILMDTIKYAITDTSNSRVIMKCSTSVI